MRFEELIDRVAAGETILTTLQAGRKLQREVRSEREAADRLRPPQRIDSWSPRVADTAPRSRDRDPRRQPR